MRDNCRTDAGIVTPRSANSFVQGANDSVRLSSCVSDSRNGSSQVPADDMSMMTRLVPSDSFPCQTLAETHRTALRAQGSKPSAIFACCSELGSMCIV